MKNYKINALQYQVLPAMLRLSQKKIAKRIGVTENCVCRHLQDGNWRIGDAMALCNAYHVRFSSFITLSDGGEIIPNAVVPDDEWSDIRFMPERIQGLIDNGTLNYKRIMKATGWSRKTLGGLFEQDCPVAKLLYFANTYGYNLGDFVSDPTLPRLTTKSKDLKLENEKLQEENRMLREEIARLERILARRPYDGYADVAYMGAAEDDRV